MAKQNNSLTELQALEGIYEHLSTIDDLAKEVGAISTRLRKIEEQLKKNYGNRRSNPKPRAFPRVLPRHLYLWRIDKVHRGVYGTDRSEECAE